ncbi:MAG: hypothetical protein JNN13_12220 [Planctomycetes bacterium]|nr:hypothetical protein [Planctomycetota bacterium]
MATPEPTASDHRRLQQLLQAEGVDASYAAFVLHHVHAPDADWRWCCGSNCDPCVQRLGRVVDAARGWLGGPPDPGRPPGLPGPDQSQ